MPPPTLPVHSPLERIAAAGSIVAIIVLEVVTSIVYYAYWTALHHAGLAVVATTVVYLALMLVLIGTQYSCLQKIQHSVPEAVE